MIISDSYLRQKPDFLRLAVLLFLCPLAAAAHDIPNDVTVQSYFKPSGNKLSNT